MQGSGAGEAGSSAPTSARSSLFDMCFSTTKACGDCGESPAVLGTRTDRTLCPDAAKRRQGFDTFANMAKKRN